MKTDEENENDDGNDTDADGVPKLSGTTNSGHRKHNKVTIAMTKNHLTSNNTEGDIDLSVSNERETTYANTRAINSEMESDEFREMNPMLYMALHAITRNDETFEDVGGPNDVIRPGGLSVHRQDSGNDINPHINVNVNINKLDDNNA